MVRPRIAQRQRLQPRQKRAITFDAKVTLGRLADQQPAFGFLNRPHHGGLSAFVPIDADPQIELPIADVGGKGGAHGQNRIVGLSRQGHEVHVRVP